MAAGAAAVAVAVAAKRRQEQEEEEVMTLMNTDSSAAVEYKIVRNVTRAFKDRTKFNAVLNEEARAGWELVEKLDDCRVRLRRPIECRKRDGELGQDPYRIQVCVRGTAALVWGMVWALVITSVATILIIGATYALLRYLHVLPPMH